MTIKRHTLQRCPVQFIVLCILLLSLAPTVARAQGVLPSPVTASPVTAGGTVPSAPEWLEPRGLSVVDLVGLVPEAHLVDTIISSRVGLGIVQYVSGSRVGETVTVNVRFEPRYWTDGNSWATLFGCLGKPAIGDEWPVAVPPASMRVYENGNEMTSQVVTNYDYVPAGQNLPEVGASGWWRYTYLWGQRTQFNDDGSVAVPANMGCGYGLPNRLTNLTATFIFTSPTYLTIEDLGSESFIFHSYIGAGNAGHISKLNEQMNRRFGNRHDKFDLAIPDNTDYVLVKFPPTPVEPYMGQPEINVFLTGSGTYRLNGADNSLSVDHVNSMAMPIFGQWQDADQSGGDYLRFFSNAHRLASPEYFVPTTVPYDACMSNGGCSNDLLDQIHNAEMTMTIYYYRIARIREGLDRVPLKQVGPDWNTLVASTLVANTVAAFNTPQRSASSQSVQQSSPLLESSPALQKGSPVLQNRASEPLDQLIYLPLIHSEALPPTELPDGDAAGCPCGWFDGYGRMFDFVPGQ